MSHDKAIAKRRRIESLHDKLAADRASRLAQWVVLLDFLAETEAALTADHQP